MKIAIDISQIAYPGSGVSRFNEGLVRAICEYENVNKWIFFFSSLRNTLDPDLKKLIQSKDHTLIESKIPPTMLAFVWNQLHFFPFERIVGKVDWIITSDWTEPPSRYKKATIVHDLVYLKYPETVADIIRNTQARRLRWIQKESSLIFADSDSTKHDLETELSIEKTRVVVNYPGLTFKQELQATSYKLQDKRPFILTVGKLEPRKNLERLIKAFNQLERTDIDLYIVGMKGWGNVAIGKGPNVKLLGFVSDAELDELYRTCLFFVMPSIYEGFGYPVLEAMSNGAPVATSNTSSLHEIAGGMAQLFDPLDEISIAQALKKLIQSKPLRQSLSKKGLARAKEFTWKKYFETLITNLKSHS